MKDIILAGPKHSGKTSAGRALAQLCSCSFIDLDDQILRITGKSPRQLFSESPAVFQKAETEAMEAVASAKIEAGQGRRIIAAGGGIIDNSDAVAIIKKSYAVVVYLNVSADVAWRRIANSAKGELPPFLRTENPQETHRSLHERRSAAYLQIANIVIEAEEKTSKEIAVEIFQHCQLKNI
jgi:shikimate kinase